MYSIFANLLKNNNVTAYRVYKETGISQSTLSDWKTGKSVPGIEKMKKIADFFGVTVDYLLTGKESQQKNTPAEAGVPIVMGGIKGDILNAMDGLDEENQRRLFEHAKLLAQAQKSPPK